MRNELKTATFIYSFNEGSKEMAALLGNKGAHLAEMTRLGLPVPPGFTITTAACTHYAKSKSHPAGLREQLAAALAALEKKTGKKLGDEKSPLLLSVRSGAAVSMPGMMDTVLNIGLTEKTLAGLIAASGNERFARDCYRRLLQMFGNVVLGIRHEQFEALPGDLVADVTDSPLNLRERDLVQIADQGGVGSGQVGLRLLDAGHVAEGALHLAHAGGAVHPRHRDGDALLGLRRHTRLPVPCSLLLVPWFLLTR